jgi:hypothetical protein
MGDVVPCFGGVAYGTRDAPVLELEKVIGIMAGLSGHGVSVAEILSTLHGPGVVLLLGSCFGIVEIPRLGISGLLIRVVWAVWVVYFYVVSNLSQR